MAYSLVIEGTLGAHRIRSGELPRPGDWISMQIGKSWKWLRVVDVSHSLTEEERLLEPEAGCLFAHSEARSVVFTSLAMSVEAEMLHEDDGYKLVMPPSRWPFGGKSPKDAQFAENSEI